MKLATIVFALLPYVFFFTLSKRTTVDCLYRVSKLGNGRFIRVNKCFSYNLEFLINSLLVVSYIKNAQ